jgi:hypothetical protein
MWNAELQKSSSNLVQEVANHQDRNNPPLTVRQEDHSRREAKRTYSTNRPKTSSLIGTSLEESKQLIYSYLSLLALNLKTTMEGGVKRLKKKKMKQWFFFLKVLDFSFYNKITIILL